MGECIFCGMRAGILRREHADCRLRYEEGKSQIIRITEHSIVNSVDNHRLVKNVEQEANRSHISDEEVQDLLHKSWKNTANRLLEAGNLSELLEDRLLAFPEYFAFPISKGERDSTLERINRARSARLREAERKRKQALQNTRTRGKQKITEIIVRHGSRTRFNKSLALKINDEAEKAKLTSRMRGNAVFAGWEEAVKAAQPKASFRSRDRESLILLAKELNITQRRLQNSKVLKEFDKQMIEGQWIKGKQEIIDLIHTEASEHVKDESLSRSINRIANTYGLQSGVQGVLLFNLIDSEELLWVFTEVDYLKEVVVRQHGYNQKEVEPTQYGMETIDCGTVGVTTRHIYFVGNKERFRIRYDRIVAFEEYPDGVGLNRDVATARHERFVTSEDCFIYGLVIAMAKQF